MPAIAEAEWRSRKYPVATRPMSTATPIIPAVPAAAIGVKPRSINNGMRLMISTEMTAEIKKNPTPIFQKVTLCRASANSTPGKALGAEVWLDEVDFFRWARDDP